jgi:ring-1,2-phenylacetyl-CoA epoxidase subunit PaaE
MTEDEYLTENEKLQGKILPCVSIAMSKDVYLDFDLH